MCLGLGHQEPLRCHRPWRRHPSWGNLPMVLSGKVLIKCRLLWMGKITLYISRQNLVHLLHFTFLARLFSKKTLRYCHSPGAVVGGGVMRKLWHFLISLLLLKIFTWNSESKGEPIPVGEVILHFFSQSYAPFSTYNFLNAAKPELWHPHAVL